MLRQNRIQFGDRLRTLERAMKVLVLEPLDDDVIVFETRRATVAAHFYCHSVTLVGFGLAVHDMEDPSQVVDGVQRIQVEIPAAVAA